MTWRAAPRLRPRQAAERERGSARRALYDRSVPRVPASLITAPAAASAAAASVERVVNALRLTFLALVALAGCYTHGGGDVETGRPNSPIDAGHDVSIPLDVGADASLDDAPNDAGSDAPDDAGDSCDSPRAHVSVCAGAISTGSRLALPFSNRGLWATAQSDRLVQLVQRALSTGLGVISVRAGLGEGRIEMDVPASALREGGLDFEILTHLGPADSRCTHWLAEVATRDGSARRSLVFSADALPAAPFRTTGAIADGATTVASRATPEGRLLALATSTNDLGACAADPSGYELAIDDAAVDGTLVRIATVARPGSAPLAAVARDGGFAVVDRACADGALELVHLADDGESRIVPISIPADGVPRIPRIPSEGGTGLLLSRRSMPAGLELSIERVDVETGAAVGTRQSWTSEDILASQTSPEIDLEGNVFWAVTLEVSPTASADWLVSFPADGSPPTALHLVDRTTLIDGSTRLRWWNGRLIVDTRTDTGFTLIELTCGG